MSYLLSERDLNLLNTQKGIKELLRNTKPKTQKAIKFLDYEARLRELQIELIKMQDWIHRKKQQVVILFEGRDAAGKGGAIRRLVQHLNPRLLRIVALPMPNEEERGQWYFQRYTNQLPKKGEIVFFDRSWYNRAVVEPVNRFCTTKEYDRFMRHLPEYEDMLTEDGLKIIKFWFSISREEQARRFELIKKNPLKRWKMSPVDEKALTLWDEYTRYKEIMFEKTHTEQNPWLIIKADKKTAARIACIKYILNQFSYDGKKESLLKMDASIINFYRPGVEFGSGYN